RTATAQTPRACHRSRHASHKAAFRSSSFRRSRLRRLAPPYLHEYDHLALAPDLRVGLSCQARGKVKLASPSRSHAINCVIPTADQYGVRPHATADLKT